LIKSQSLRIFAKALSHSPFVLPDRSCYHDVSRTARAIWMKLIGNIQWSLLMTWLDSGGQRSMIKVTAGHQGAEGIHVDAGTSNGPSHFSSWPYTKSTTV